MNLFFIISFFFIIFRNWTIAVPNNFCIQIIILIIVLKNVLGKIRGCQTWVFRTTSSFRQVMWRNLSKVRHIFLHLLSSISAVRIVLSILKFARLWNKQLGVISIHKISFYTSFILRYFGPGRLHHIMCFHVFSVSLIWVE